MPINAEDNIDCVYPSQLLDAGVYLVNCLVTPYNKQAVVRVINLNDYAVKINKYNK